MPELNIHRSEGTIGSSFPRAGRVIGRKGGREKGKGNGKK